jgi:hypothetical protein
MGRCVRCRNCVDDIQGKGDAGVANDVQNT